jgi:hypothetical protein
MENNLTGASSWNPGWTSTPTIWLQWACAATTRVFSTTHVVVPYTLSFAVRSTDLGVLDVVNWLQSIISVQWTTVLARTQHSYTNRVEDASVNDMLRGHPLLCARLIRAVPSCCALGVVCCCTLSPGRFSPPCSTRAITIATTAVFPSHHAGLRCYMPSPVAGLTPRLNFSCRCHSPRRTAVLLSPTPLESNLRAVPQHPTVL